MRIKNVLSLFDGMSCGQIALNRAKIKYDNYYASEIKKHAIKVTLDNYPKTIQLGSVLDVNWFGLPKIDFLIGGSPCQDFSRLKNNDAKGLSGDKSVLFYEYLRILKQLDPKYFILENVMMKQHFQDELSEFLGCKPIRINSNKVSYQNRDRLYWTNIPNVTQPNDKDISFQDYKGISDRQDISLYKVNKTPSRIKMYEKQCPNVTYRAKVNCLTCKQDRRNNSGLVDYEDFCRYLTVDECEIAQTVPIGYTKSVSVTQAYDLLGDGWTVDVIAHILSFIK